MSQSYSSASSTPIPAGKETGESVAGTTTKFTLKNWRIWAASFGFFWTLFVCGVLSMYSFKYAGGGSELMQEEILTLPLIQDTIFAILAPFVFVIAARHPIQYPDRIRRSFSYFGGGVLFTIAHVLI